MRPSSFHYLHLLKSKTTLEFAEAAFEFQLLLGFFAEFEEGRASCRRFGEPGMSRVQAKVRQFSEGDPFLG